MDFNNIFRYPSTATDDPKSMIIVDYFTSSSGSSLVNNANQLSSLQNNTKAKN